MRLDVEVRESRDFRESGISHCALWETGRISDLLFGGRFFAHEGAHGGSSGLKGVGRGRELVRDGSEERGVFDRDLRERFARCPLDFRGLGEGPVREGDGIASRPWGDEVCAEAAGFTAAGPKLGGFLRGDLAEARRSVLKIEAVRAQEQVALELRVEHSLQLFRTQGVDCRHEAQAMVGRRRCSLFQKGIQLFERFGVWRRRR